MQKYNIIQSSIENLISWVTSGEIAIPEIQRPFVWSSSQVRDLIDSLYRGYPVGYLIIWKNPDVKLKDGSISTGKKIIIDGQQRIIALTTAIVGKEVVDKDFKKIRIQIAFNPIEERFEVINSAIEKDKKWIKDISPIITDKIFIPNFLDEYLQENPSIDKKKIWSSLERLKNIMKKQIGIIELAGELDIETVTEIFIRINSRGVELSQADFAMSKIASNEIYGGNILRKAIDYFAHLAVKPEFYSEILNNDKEFAQTDFFKKISWLKNENDDLYDPSYKDILRVAFTYKFNRGKLKDLVSLLSGRNFETREYEEEIARNSFQLLKEGVMAFINEYDFKGFVMTIKSAGFIDKRLIRSVNALNFAYILYLKLREQKYEQFKLEKIVRRWFVMSLLTGRYSGSTESIFDYDIKQFAQKGFEQYLSEIETEKLSDAFWNAELVRKLETSVSSAPVFNVFLAAQCYFNDKAFLSKDYTVRTLIEQRGDIHHIFPKDVLKKQGLTRGEYNQVANYVYIQTEVNIKIKNKPIEVYMKKIKEQCNGGEVKYGSITNYNELMENFKQNAIPETVLEMTTDDYKEFLVQRRKLMAEKIKEYYYSL